MFTTRCPFLPLVTPTQCAPSSVQIAILCTAPLDAYAGLIGEISFNAIIPNESAITVKQTFVYKSNVISSSLNEFLIDNYYNILRFFPLPEDF